MHFQFLSHSFIAYLYMHDVFMWHFLDTMYLFHTSEFYYWT
jgi:hypothetical protein